MPDAAPLIPWILGLLITGILTVKFVAPYIAKLVADGALERFKGELAKELETHKRQEGERLEGLKARLRAEIERDLVEQEARWRVRSEVELRLLERMWGLLREVASANTRTQIAMNQTGRAFLDTLEADPSQRDSALGRYAVARGEMIEALQILSSLFACLPREARSVRDTLRLYRDALEALGRTPTGEGARREWQKDVTSKITTAYARCQEAAEAWNYSLWDKEYSTLDPSQLAVPPSAERVKA